MNGVEPGRIRAENLGRRFSIAAQGGRSLKATFLGRDHAKPRDFWALRHVDLDIEPGETFGIVGRNGSGKSTLLKMLARIFGPSEGACAVGGRLSSLLELGAGFHPEFSAIENIFLSAAIYGIPQDDARKQVESIIDFAELEDFKDQPVKTFSSGMFARLGFSVAMHVEPDVLLLDEVLAVGDEAFMQKCHRRIAEYHRSGGTVVVVSHSAELVERVCTRALLLHGGAPRLVASATEVLTAYQDLVAHDARGASTERPAPIADGAFAVGTRVIDDSGAARETFVEGERVMIEIDIEAAEPARGIYLAVVLKDDIGRGLTRSVLRDVECAPGDRKRYVLAFDRLPLASGTFGVDVGIRRMEDDERLFYADTIAAVTVLPRSTSDGGIVAVESRWIT